MPVALNAFLAEPRIPALASRVGLSLQNVSFAEIKGVLQSLQVTSIELEGVFAA